LLKKETYAITLTRSELEPTLIRTRRADLDLAVLAVPICLRRRSLRFADPTGHPRIARQTAPTIQSAHTASRI